MPSASPIRFNYLVHQFYFPQREPLKEFLIQLFRKHKIKLDQLSYVFCDDEYLLSINQRFLGHDTYTDIITFPLSLPGQPLIADIYISIPRLRENSETHSAHFSTELLRVIFHGALHLCGFKDKSSHDQAIMRRQEDLQISRFLFHVKRTKVAR